MSKLLAIDPMTDTEIDEIAALVGVAFMMVGNGNLYAAVKAGIHKKWIPKPKGNSCHYAKYWPTHEGSDTLISDLARAYPDFNAEKAIGLTVRTH